MQITDILARTGGVQAMAGELGMRQDEAASGAAVLLPAILGGLKKQAQARPGGLDGLLGGGAGSVGTTTGLGSMLDMNGDGNALDDILRMADTALR